MVVIQQVTREVRGEGLWDLLYTNDLVITAESEKEAVRKFSVWKKEMLTRRLQVNIKSMVATKCILCSSHNFTFSEFLRLKLKTVYLEFLLSQ